MRNGSKRRETKNEKRFNLTIGEGWINYPDVGVIKDDDVAKFTIKHMRFIDRFSPRKIVNAAFISQLIFMKVEKEPKWKDWKYHFESKKGGEDPA